MSWDIIIHSVNIDIEMRQKISKNITKEVGKKESVLSCTDSIKEREGRCTNLNSGVFSHTDDKKRAMMADTELEIARGQPGSVRAHLKEGFLWKAFHEHQNEMLLTRAGRRLFPVPSFRLEGLDPKTRYSCELRLVSSDYKRYSFNMRTSKWLPIGTVCCMEPSRYCHPMGGSLGADWLDDGARFDKLKIGNVHRQKVVGLESQRKYRLQLVITSLAPRCERWFFDFPETEFMTVTCYQNPEIRKLKIANNPYAKAFRSNRSTPKEHPAKRPRLETPQATQQLPTSSEVRYIPVSPYPSHHEMTSQQQHLFPAVNASTHTQISSVWGSHEAGLHPQWTPVNQVWSNDAQQTYEVTNPNAYWSTPIKTGSANQMLRWSPMSINCERNAEFRRQNCCWPTATPSIPDPAFDAWTDSAAEVPCASGSLPGNAYNWYSGVTEEETFGELRRYIQYDSFTDTRGY
ncbi:T-box transcription factor TBX19-like [Nematostella vectensis]|uniref:T-box transcription factor TBX19-like n=1 Tax=Nematostella vectensis TaxID=45351 RepID=UPI002077953A|nr:T-box transcription factor TBX19-like [Nematostella vectensis]